MSQSVSRKTSVETPTEYEADIECDHPITLQLPGMSQKEIVYVAQRLSLFLEVPEQDTLADAIEAVWAADWAIVPSDEDTEVFDVAWPVVIMIEDVSEAVATALRMKIAKTAEEQTDELIAELARLLEVATKDGQRSIVRMERHDGSTRPDLEWHTDTDRRSTEE